MAIEKHALKILLAVYAVIALLIIILFDGTGDAGDSVLHYLFAKSAPSHPELFFNHWAKPIFTLFASPFAQFGFVGIKIFNAITIGFSIYFTIKSAELLGLKKSWLSGAFIMLSPMALALTFSGLTEPLAATFVSAALFLSLKNRFLLAAIIVSFIPFIRSEGLIIAGVFGFYLLLKKQWKYIPALLVGHLVYSIAGFPFYDDFLWIFTKIPYSKLSSTYGEGAWNHFIQQLLYVVGIPIYALFWIGTLAAIIYQFKKKITLEFSIQVVLGAWVFIAAHSVFWTLGIFNSMGLIRVLIAVIPCIVLISLYGFNTIIELIPVRLSWLKTGLSSVVLIYIVVFPFTSNPAAFHWKKQFKLLPDQEAAQALAEHIKKTDLSDKSFVYAHPYLSEVLALDHFDTAQVQQLNAEKLNQLRENEIVIWDNWFSVVELGLTKEFMNEQTQLKRIEEFKTPKGEVFFVVYKRI
ncbi:MAG: hypothetical protein NWS53_06650 [Salibacteraceae bacterium]|nr:hypothetical protein [Salibacteraceae bacterium]